MFKKFIILSLSLIFLAAPVCFAQEMETMDDMLEFTFGTLVRVSNDAITISEYNFEQEKEMEQNYAVTPETEFVNVENLSALKIGEEIEIEFKVKDGQKVAMAIAKDEDLPVDDIEETTEGTAEDEATTEEMPAQEQQ